MKLLTVRQTAELLAISSSLVYRLTSEGKLPAYRLGAGAIRFREDEILLYLDSCRIETERRRSPSRPKHGRPFTQLDGERLRSAWRQRGVHTDLRDERSAQSSE